MFLGLIRPNLLYNSTPKNTQNPHTWSANDAIRKLTRAHIPVICNGPAGVAQNTEMQCLRRLHEAGVVVRDGEDGPDDRVESKEARVDRMRHRVREIGKGKRASQRAVTRDR